MHLAGLGILNSYPVSFSLAEASYGWRSETSGKLTLQQLCMKRLRRNRVLKKSYLINFKLLEVKALF